MKWLPAPAYSEKNDFDLRIDPLDLSPIIKSEESKKTVTQFGMEFVYIPPGIFKMGNPEQETGRSEYETSHMVLLAQGFYMQTTPLTQNQWQTVMENNPSEFKGDGDRPVEQVSWHDVHDFIKRLNDREGRMIFSLPSEAQWEYACRAGTQTLYYSGDTKADLDRVGWYCENANGTTHPVAQKEPNSFGLYDMHGNVFEWVEDDWHDDCQGAPLDGVACAWADAWIDNPRGSFRMIRGGCWGGSPRYCQSAYRYGVEPGDSISLLGFRLVLDPR